MDSAIASGLFALAGAAIGVFGTIFGNYLKSKQDQGFSLKKDKAAREAELQKHINDKKESAYLQAIAFLSSATFSNYVFEEELDFTAQKDTLNRVLAELFLYGSKEVQNAFVDWFTNSAVTSHEDLDDKAKDEYLNRAQACIIRIQNYARTELGYQIKLSPQESKS